MVPRPLLLMMRRFRSFTPQHTPVPPVASLPQPAPNAAPKPAAPPVQAAPDAGTAANPDERAQRLGRMVAEYRQLQAQVNALNFDELTLINRPTC